MVRCNDMLGARGTLDMLSCLPRLRRLHLEGLQTHFDPAGLARLGALTALEELSVTCDELERHYVGGLRLLRLPDSWAALKNVRCASSLCPVRYWVKEPGCLWAALSGAQEVREIRVWM